MANKLIYGGTEFALNEDVQDLTERIRGVVSEGRYEWFDVSTTGGRTKILVGPGIPIAVHAAGNSRFW